MRRLPPWLDLSLLFHLPRHKQVAVLALLLIASCGPGGGPTNQPGPPPIPTPDPAPDQPPCGPGISAEDLSGKCRATPQATMGALEAVECAGCGG